MDSLKFANTASEKLIESMEWLNDELTKRLSSDDPLLALVEHNLAETYRVATLCALAYSQR